MGRIGLTGNWMPVERRGPQEEVVEDPNEKSLPFDPDPDPVAPVAVDEPDELPPELEAEPEPSEFVPQLAADDANQNAATSGKTTRPAAAIRRRERIGTSPSFDFGSLLFIHLLAFIRSLSNPHTHRAKRAVGAHFRTVHRPGVTACVSP